jgi:hypothetical protein
VLEVRRQRQALAEVLRVLVHREAGAERCDLEQDAARLAEVDRLEVEAVDDRRRAQARALDGGAPGLVIRLLGRPRDVVHRSRSLHAARSVTS